MAGGQVTGGQDVRNIHEIAEGVVSRRGVTATLARASRWLGTHALRERVRRVLRAVAPLIDDAPRGAAGVAGRLVERGSVRQMRASDDAPTWREGEPGRALDLEILEVGGAAASDNPQATSPQAQVDTTASAMRDAGCGVEASSLGGGQWPAAAVPAAIASTRTLVVDLPRRNEGAAIDDLGATTDGLPAHHARHAERPERVWPCHRRQHGAASNGAHLRARRDHDDSGGVPIMAAAAKRADAGVSPSIARHARTPAGLSRSALI